MIGHRVISGLDMDYSEIPGCEEVIDMGCGGSKNLAVVEPWKQNLANHIEPVPQPRKHLPSPKQPPQHQENDQQPLSPPRKPSAKLKLDIQQQSHEKYQHDRDKTRQSPRAKHEAKSPKTPQVKLQSNGRESPKQPPQQQEKNQQPLSPPRKPSTKLKLDIQQQSHEKHQHDRDKTRQSPRTKNEAKSPKTPQGKLQNNERDRKPYPPKLRSQLSSEIIPSGFRRQGYALPSCLHHTDNMPLPSITRSQLAEHNDHCKKSLKWTDVWTLDSDFVYNGHTLVSNLQELLDKAYMEYQCMSKFKLDEFMRLLSHGIYAAGMFYLREMDVGYEDERNIKCASLVGILSPETEERQLEQERSWLQGLSDDNEIRDGDHAFSALIDRQLKRLYDTRKPYYSGDINKRDFPIPEDIKSSDLRPWIMTWNKFDCHLENDPFARDVVWLDPEDRNPDTHSVYAELVAADRRSFDTYVDGDVWVVLPEGVIENDQLTKNQVQVLEERKRKQSLSKQQKTKRHQTILGHLGTKHKLQATQLIRYQSWIEEGINSWTRFQEVCQTWSASQKPNISVRDPQPLPNAVHIGLRSSRTLTSDIPNSEAHSELWDKLLSDEPSWTKIQEILSHRPQGNITCMFGPSVEFDPTPSKPRQRLKSKEKASDNQPIKISDRGLPPDELATRAQLELIEEDLTKDHSLCNSTHQDLAKLIRRHLNHAQPVLHAEIGRRGDPNNVIVELPEGTELRPYLDRHPKLTKYPEPPEKSDRSSFDWYKHPDIERRSSIVAIEAKDVRLQGSNRRLRRDKPCPCCRSSDLMCFQCRSMFRQQGFGAFRFAHPAWSAMVGVGQQWVDRSCADNSALDQGDDSDRFIPARVNEQRMVGRRQKIFQYFAEKYKYSQELDVYRGWADRMNEAWKTFQTLCD